MINIVYDTNVQKCPFNSVHFVILYFISAPVVSTSPTAAPPTKVPHLPVPSRSSEGNSNAHSNLLTIIGICVGILIMIFVAVIIICACSHCKSNKPLAEDAETCKFLLTSLLCYCGKLLYLPIFNIPGLLYCQFVAVFSSSYQYRT